MAELEIHSLEDGNTCNKCKSKRNCTCGDKSVNGDPANSGNYNIINIGNDVMSTQRENTDNVFDYKVGGSGGGGKNTHTKETIIQEREIPQIIEKFVPMGSADSAYMMAQNEAKDINLPFRLFKGSSPKSGNYAVIHRAFY